MIDKSLIGRNGTRQELFVEEWGGSVVIKKLTVGEIQNIMKNTSEDKADMKAMIVTVISALEDEQGRPVFNFTDMDSLMEESFAVILKVYNAVTSFNNIEVDTKKKS